jgi:2-(1,2-epoxy-1,2-dihydrophenyl)acetyl-CoA isomerase
MGPIHKLNLTELGIGQTLTIASATELLRCLRLLATDPTIKAVLVAGNSEVFCGGGQEGLVQQIVGRIPETYGPFVRELRAFPLPVVIAMEGGAYGAGLGLALALGDFLIAAEESRYGFHFVRMGITPGMGLSFLLGARVGVTLAREMFFTGKLYRGRELKGLTQGQTLFDRIVPKRQVLAEAEFLANQIAQSPRLTLVEMKKLLQSDPVLLDQAMAKEVQAFMTLGTDPATIASIHQYFAWTKNQGIQNND